MRIKPGRDDFRKWIACIPDAEDLVFLSKEKANIFANYPFKIFRREQIKCQGQLIWTLNLRSWYGYALNSADYCALVPIGYIEGFDENLKDELLNEQRRFNLPTIIEGRWITTWVWSHLSDEEKIDVLQRWFIQNEISIYESIELIDLPVDARSELCRVGFDKWLNRFQHSSGPNCFATVASSIENSSDVFSIWMHWPDLEQRLRSSSFGRVVDDPRAGDILIFEKDETPIHAGYFLGDRLYFEKAGQDFYEPYRVAKLDEWSTACPDSKLTVWRKS